MATLSKALEAVHDRATFLTFVQVLIQAAGSGDATAPGWANTTIEAYFEAALACVRDNEGRRDFLAEPSWRGFAEFLYCGTMYE